MATQTFSFAEALTPSKTPANARARRRGILPPNTSSNVTSDKHGELPKDSALLATIRAAAEKYGVPVEYGLALAQQESGYNPAAYNDEFGAAGLMQFIPETAKSHGIDPLDPAQSADAAMRDFAAAMEDRGVEWAIKHHFAGPNESGHGPKTRQYLADVQKRAEDIRGLLASRTSGVGGSTEEGPRQSNAFSFEEAVGNITPDVHRQPPVDNKDSDTPLPFRDDFLLNRVGAAVGDKLREGFEFVQNRVLTELGQIPVDDPRYRPGAGQADPFAENRDIRERAKERAKLPVSRTEEGKSFWQNFAANIGNPADLILNDSLPANAIEALARAPQSEREAIQKARQVTMQQNIVDNPDKFPEVAVQAAQREIDRRRNKQDPGVRQMWDDLRQAAKEDPANFAAQFANAIIADPELLAAPVGLGTRVLATTKTLATGAKNVSRVTKIADKIIDAGSVEAALNVGIEAAQAASVGDEFTAKEAARAAAIGAAIGGPFGAIFSRGGEARVNLRNKSPGELTPEDLEASLRAVAKEDLLKEQVIENPESIPTEVRDRIEAVLGIENLTKAERRKRLERERRQWKKIFMEDELDLDYQQYKVEERILRSEQLARESAERSARAQAEAAAAKDSSVDAAWAQHEAGRLAGLREEYDAALQARAESELADPRSAAAAEARVAEITNKLDEEEIFDAAFDSAPAVQRAMNSALRRDANLRRPKWQRGEVDPKLLARVGAGGIFAGTAFAIAPEEQKAEAAFAAGLASLMIPGGGRVLRRLNQSGAVSMDGSIPGLAELVKNGKLKPDVDVQAARANETALLARAKQGDSKAQAEIYNEHFPRVERFVKKFVREAGPKLGIDAEDVAQEVFVKFFQNIEGFRGDSGIYTYLQTLARNSGIDAVREAQTLKGGGDYQIGSMYSPVSEGGESLTSGHIMDGGAPLVKSEVEAAAADIESPEYKVLYDEAQKRLLAAVKGLPDTQQTVFLLNKVEGLTAQEIADRFSMPISTVLSHMKRATDAVTDLIEKDFNAKKLPKKTVAARQENIPASEIDPNTGRRRRGRPRKQAGEIDPRLLKVGGVAALGAGAGAYLNEKNRELGALTGALLLPGALMLKGRSGKTAAQHVTNVADYTLGITSTRLKNIAEPIWRKAIELERFILRDTHKHLSNVAPFLRDLQKMPEQTRDILTRAILTGDARVTDNILKALGNEEVIKNWKAVRSTLDSLGDQLIHLRRFKKGQFEYFPRMVKDVSGLLKALGRERASFIEESLKAANESSISNRGTGLTELEQSAIVNKILSTDARKSAQPGFAKNRGVEEITPELQQFYHSPAESLHSYIQSAVEDIERAKFFGKDLEVVVDKESGKEYTNVDKSVGHIVNRLNAEGKLTPEQTEEVGKLMKSRFTSGERVPHEIIQHAKNLAYAGLLGNPFSAAVQLGDVIIQAFTQDLRSTMYAIAQKVGRNQKVSMKDFGLADHIAEEFTSTTKSAKALRFIMASTLFRAVDHFGKDIALNAAINKYGRWAKSEGGIRKIQERYGDALAPGEMDQLIKDLQKGEPTDLVRSIAFAELSRTQPITRLEMPQAYLDSPTGRVAYMLKTFMLKQIDLARREGWNEFKKGNYAKGIKNLTELGIVMGLAGTSTNVIKDFLLGKDVDLEATDIAENALKTFGLSKYFLDEFLGVSKEEAAERRAEGEVFARKRDAAPLQAIGKQAVPPAKMFDQIVTGQPEAVRYIPWIGPYLYEQMKAAKEKK